MKRKFAPLVALGAAALLLAGCTMGSPEPTAPETTAPESGGSGEMVLLESDDVLEAGVEIIAQPPGKRLQNMLLLSGGFGS